MHSAFLCSPFLYFSKLRLYAQDTILFKIFLFFGRSLLIFSHSTQARICLPGRCLSPTEQMVSLQSCAVFTVSQFLPDSMLSWWVAPTLHCAFSSFLVPPWDSWWKVREDSFKDYSPLLVLTRSICFKFHSYYFEILKIPKITEINKYPHIHWDCDVWSKVSNICFLLLYPDKTLQKEWGQLCSQMWCHKPLSESFHLSGGDK